MNYGIYPLSISIKDLPFNTEKNFLKTLKNLQTKKPLLVGKDDEIRCESKYLKSLQKIEESKLVKKSTSEKLRSRAINFFRSLIKNKRQH